MVIFSSSIYVEILVDAGRATDSFSRLSIGLLDYPVFSTWNGFNIGVRSVVNTSLGLWGSPLLG